MKWLQFYTMLYQFFLFRYFPEFLSNSSSIIRIIELTLGIITGRGWVQYDRYFSNFSYFAIYFTNLQASETIAKYENEEKICHICHKTNMR